MPETTISTPTQPPLEEEARQVLQRIRRAFAAIIDAVCGQMPRTTDIAEGLQVHRKLAWQISKITYGQDPFAAARFVPAPGITRTFLAAARRRRVPDELIVAAGEAISDFEELVATHADDRESLHLMLLGCAAHPDDQAEVALRQSAFVGNAFIWGVQAKTRLVANFVYPAAVSTRFDLLRLRGFLGLRRNRPNLPWIVSYTRTATDNWAALRDVPEPIEHVGDLPIPLLREFCSQPLPEFRRRDDGHGFVVDELASGRVGNTGAVTFFTGEISRSVCTRYRDEHNTFNEFAARNQTPAEVLIFDLYVHEGLFGVLEPHACLYSELAGPSPRDDQDRMPLAVRVRHLGKGLDAIHTADVPRYVPLVQHVLDRVGWNESYFDVFRVRLEYPPLPTVLAISHPLPAPPNGE